MTQCSVGKRSVRRAGRVEQRGVVLVRHQGADRHRDRALLRQPEPGTQAEGRGGPDDVEIDAGVHHDQAIGRNPVVAEHGRDRFGNGDDTGGAGPEPAAAEGKIDPPRGDQGKRRQQRGDPGQRHRVGIVGMQERRAPAGGGDDGGERARVEPGPPDRPAPPARRRPRGDAASSEPGPVTTAWTTSPLRCSSRARSHTCRCPPRHSRPEATWTTVPITRAAALRWRCFRCRGEWPAGRSRARSRRAGAAARPG